MTWDKAGCFRIPASGLSKQEMSADYVLNP